MDGVSLCCIIVGMKSNIKAKRQAWDSYDAWRKVNSYSPALDCEVKVSLLGWRHITGATGAKKRVTRYSIQ